MRSKNLSTHSLSSGTPILSTKETNKNKKSPVVEPLAKFLLFLLVSVTDTTLTKEKGEKKI